MSEYISAQLDFILFLYGLAFILFGMVALAISHMRRIGGWQGLAAFGLVHGFGEWLDLIALITGDTPLFAMIRVAVMATSFLCLVEAARREASGFGIWLPGPWIHLPLALVPAIAGWLGGSLMAGIVARYCLALPGALIVGALLVLHAKALSGGKRRAALGAGVLMIAYGFAAGVVVPVAPFWPANTINTASFAEFAGLPIQLARGSLAAGLAICSWSIWGRIAGANSGSERYAAFLRRMFTWVMLSLGITLIGGWVITQVLGNIYRAEIEDEAEGDFNVLESSFNGESANVRALAKMLAEDPAILALIPPRTPGAEGAPATSVATARATLDAAIRAVDAAQGFVLDSDGKLLVGTTESESALATFRTTPSYGHAFAGTTGQSLSYDPSIDVTSIFVAAPLRPAGGGAAGAVVLQRSLAALQGDLEDFDRPWFLLDPEGVIVMSNRSELKFHALSPVPARKLQRLRQQYPALVSQPLVQNVVADRSWVNFQGARTLFRRSGGERSWSIVLALPPAERFASRALGIVITLLATLVALTYLLGRERQVHDNIEMERMLELQLIAQDLRSKAYTDPLTGLFNRLRFDHALAEEIARCERYRTPLALVLFDIDHFKRVNDTFGHQAGDAVLARLARLAAGSTRNMDVLARWGGEEFVLLTPGCDIAAAGRAAEKLRLKIAETQFETVGQVTSSFGVAQFEPGDTPQSIVARADEALYQAKGAGRNRVMSAVPRRAAE